MNRQSSMRLVERMSYDPEKHRVLVSDALSGLVWRDEKRFEEIYDALGRMAVVIA